MILRKAEYLLIVLLAVIFTAVIPSCKAEQEYTKSTFTFDTFVTFRILKTNGSSSPDEICGNAIKMLNELDDKLSAQKENSEITRINNNAYKTPVITDNQTYQLIKNCVDLCRLTDGAFDITLGGASDIWGFGKDNPVKPDFEELKSLGRLKNYENIVFDDENLSIRFTADNFAIDLGGAAKGYALDMLKALLTKSGVQSAVVDFGGSILTVGNYNDGSWNISVTADNTDKSTGTLNVSECFVSTSNAARRFVEYEGIKYHHIIDTNTAFPAESDIKSCTVVCDSGLISDALSTAVFVMGKEKAAEFYKELPIAEFIITDNNGCTTATGGLNGRFTAAE